MELTFNDQFTVVRRGYRFAQGKADARSAGFPVRDLSTI